MTQLKTVLHVGCGPRSAGIIHPFFSGPGWKEIRVDIDPKAEPDIVASLTDLNPVTDNSMDGLYSSHNLEHLYPHEVQQGLNEFSRVLKPDGVALIAVPDLQEVAKLIAEDKLDEPAYQSPAGPITPLDILYGHRPSLAHGNLFMAHRTGFTQKTLVNAILTAGFAWVMVAKDTSFGLWAKAYKSPPSKEVAEGPIW